MSTIINQDVCYKHKTLDHDYTTMQVKAVVVSRNRVNENNFIKNDLFEHIFVSSSVCNCIASIPRCLEIESVLLFGKGEYCKYKPMKFLW